MRTRRSWRNQDRLYRAISRDLARAAQKEQEQNMSTSTSKSAPPPATAAEAATVAAAVAAALGPDWTVGPIHRDGDKQPLPYHRTPIVHQAGYSFDLSFDPYRNEGRIEVSANYPKNRDGHEQYPYGSVSEPRAPSITVSRQTPPAKIAAEIQRRFLPAYLPIWTRALAKLQGANAHADQTERTVLELIAQGHGKRGYHSHQANIVYAGGNSHVYQLTADGDDVRFEAFSCPLAVALAILPLLRKGSVQPENAPDPVVAFEANRIGPAWPTDADQAAFEAHRQADPHCTCNDCLDYHEAQMRVADLEAEEQRKSAELEARQAEGYNPDDGPQDTRDL